MSVSKKDTKEPAVNPFAGPFGQNGPFGTDPIASPGTAGLILCPACQSDDFHAYQNQYETVRKCNKCGNKWSGGVVAKPDLAYPEVMEGVPVPEDEGLPLDNYAGQSFRDPYRNYGGDE